MKQLTIIFLYFLSFITTYAYNKIGGLYYNINNITKTAEVTANPNNYSGSVVIPREITFEGTEYSVTSIGEKAFWNCDGLTSVSIPNSVTIIGKYAFYGCRGLKSITIPQSVTTISTYAFWNCDGLTSIKIPSNVTSIGNTIFTGCSSLTSIEIDGNNAIYDSRDNCNAIIETASNKLICGCNTSIIPYGITSIEQSAFEECSSLPKIEIPSSVTSIGKYAFYSCSSLKSINIPEGISCIAEGSFQGCKGLNTVKIPNSVKTIEDYAFSRCWGLTSVTIPNSVTTIGKYAFNECISIVSITIPNSVTTIDDGTFAYCYGLSSVKIPNSVTTIGSGVFLDCSSLTSVTCYAKKVPATTGYSFEEAVVCKATLYVPAESLNAYKAAKDWCKFGKILPIEDTTVEVTSINLNSSSVSITEGDTYELKATIVPNNATDKTITWKSSNTAIATVSSSGLVTAKSSGTATITATASNGKKVSCEVTIIAKHPDEVHNVAGKVCYYNIFNSTNYAEVTHNGKLDSNGRPDGSTYSGSVSIPASITYDGKYFPVTSIGDRAFHNCTNLTAVSIPNSIKNIGFSSFSFCPKLTGITIPNSVLTIGKSAFYNCVGLASIIMSNSVTSIGDYAFEGCNSLQSIDIPNSVTNIGHQAFYDCSNLTSVTCHAKKVPTTNDSFDEALVSKATLYVPAESLNAYKSAKDWCKFGKILPIGETTVEVTSVSLNSSSVSITEGDTYELKATIVPNNATDKTVSWKSSNTAIATVSSSGLVTAKSSGTVTITATASNGKKVSCEVTVIAKQPDEVHNVPGKVCYYNIYIKANYAEVTHNGKLDSNGRPDGSTYSGSVSIPSSITYNNTKFSITRIGDYAFFSCYPLTSVSIPNSVTIIGDASFALCSFLSSITIPNSVKNIGRLAFYGCGVASMVIPNSVTSIGNDAFGYCSKLLSIEIPNSVTNIGHQAFYDCSALTSVACYAKKVPTTNDSFDEALVSKATLYVPAESLNAYKSAKDWCKFGKILPLGDTTVEVTSVSLNSSSVSITEGDTYELKATIAPNNATDKTITWKSSNTAIATVSSSGLVTAKSSGTATITATASNGKQASCVISITDEIRNFSINGYYYNIYFGAGYAEVTHNGKLDSDGLPVGNSYSGIVDIPSSITYNGKKIPVTSIGDEAFFDCSQLTSVTIPNTITNIGNTAFAYCSSLTSITIPNSVTNIGNAAFAVCFNLTSLTIPNSVTNIGYLTFFYCENLSTIDIPISVTSIGDQAFYGCYALSSVICRAKKVPATVDSFDVLLINDATLYVPIDNIKQYRSYSPWSYFGTILPLNDDQSLIDAVNNDTYTTNEYYTIDGQKQSSISPGRMSIIKTGNKDVKKIIMK